MRQLGMDAELKTIDLIKKLLAHANSASELGNAAEAGAFAAKAEELLLRHKLGMTDLEFAEEEKEPISEEVVDPYGDEPPEISRRRPKSRQAWRQNLVAAVARAHFCRVLSILRSRRVIIIGKPQDREIVIYLIQTLCRNGERLASANYHVVRRQARERGEPMPHQPLRAFLLGYTKVIRERLAAMRRDVEQMGGQYAIIRLADAEAAVERYYNRRPHQKGPGLGSNVAWDNASFEAGKKAGAAASLHGGLKDAPRPGTLARAQQLLRKGE